MSVLYYDAQELYIENVPLKAIAQQFGTPCYVYSRDALEKNWHSFDNAFNAVPHQICYAVKANSNIAILSLFAKLGSGFDIVSMGELHRVIVAGGDTKKIIFSGVGKTEQEIIKAIQQQIYCFNVESEPELERLHHIASQMQTTINIGLRINPDVNPFTHRHIATGLKENKFGIAIQDIIPLYQKIAALPRLKLIGLACHIGSQLVELTPFLQAVEHLLEIYTQLQKLGVCIQDINIGGGLGITYHDEHPPCIVEYANALQKKLANYPVKIILEPGRAIVGNAGVLLTRIEYVKHTGEKNFAIVDAGMNDLLRPALYNAWQDILPVKQRQGREQLYDIAGPVCESADFLGKKRKLVLAAGDLLAIDAVGAYGFSMSSNYNSRLRPAEILVADDKAYLIRRRETLDELLSLEKIVEKEI